MRRILLAIGMALLSSLLTLVYAIPENNATVQLLDIDGNSLPLEVLNNLFFRIGWIVFNASHFMNFFNGTMLANLSAEYYFYDRNWSLGFTVNSTKENFFVVYLKLKNLSNLDIKFYNLTSEYVVTPHLTKVASVINDPLFASLSITIHLGDSDDPLRFVLGGSGLYLPVASDENHTYPWIMEVYYGESLLASANLADLTGGEPLELPLLVVPQMINLTHVLGVDPSCNLSVRLTCGSFTLSSKPPQLALISPNRWIQPRRESCTVEYFIEDSPHATCNERLENIFYTCRPRIYTLRMSLENADENVFLIVNSSKVKSSKPIVCLTEGNYSISIFYNFSGLVLKVWERNITIDSNYHYTVRLNFSDIILRTDEHCPPKVYINGAVVPIQKQGITYVIKHFPRIPVNITINACEFNLLLDISPLGDLVISIIMPSPPIYEVKSTIELTPLVILLAIIMIQVLLLIFLLFKLRGD